MEPRFWKWALGLAAFMTSAMAIAQAKKPSIELQQRLIHAVIQDEIENVRALLEQGGDPNARVELAKEDKWCLEHTSVNDPAPPLFVLACRYGSIKGPVIIQMLIDKGADINIADKNGVTPLMVASELGFTTSLLLDHKAKVNVSDRNGKTPLMYAMGNRGLGSAAALLKHGANINARDNEGTTALMMAIRNAEYDPFRLILDDQKKKAVEAKQRYIELVQFLINNGADVNIKDNNGNSALSVVPGSARKEISAILRKAGAKG